jgi:hypothetical protein
MSINIGPPSVGELRPRISVIGVGGAGGNAIANMIDAEIEGVDFIVANTDAQALNNAVAEHRIQLGPDITQGLGAGSRPEVGRAAAEETVAEIERALEGPATRRRRGRRNYECFESVFSPHVRPRHDHRFFNCDFRESIASCSCRSSKLNSRESGGAGRSRWFR